MGPGKILYADVTGQAHVSTPTLTVGRGTPMLMSMGMIGRERRLWSKGMVCRGLHGGHGQHNWREKGELIEYVFVTRTRFGKQRLLW